MGPNNEERIGLEMHVLSVFFSLALKKLTLELRQESDDIALCGTT